MGRNHSAIWYGSQLASVATEDACGMPKFMRYLSSNLAREVGRLADWKEKFWGRRYQHIVVSDEARVRDCRHTGDSRRANEAVA